MTPLGLAVAVVAALFVLSAGADFILPAAARIPIHWGLNGQPDRLWPRRPALYLLPLTSAALFAFILALPGQPPRPALWLLSAIQSLVQAIYLGSVFIWAARQNL